MFCGIAMILFHVETRRGFVPAQCFILAAGLLALLAIIGHVYQVLLLNRLGSAFPMSLDTALALVFFCLWAIVYLFIWAHDPAACPADTAHPCAGAFLGAGRHPTFGDFLYYSVNMAFANPAPDLIAHTRAGHTAATIEVLSGVGLVTLYAGAFFGLGAVQARERDAEPTATIPPAMLASPGATPESSGPCRQDGSLSEGE